MLLLSYRYFVGLLLVVVCCFAVSFAQSDQKCTANSAGSLGDEIFDGHEANAADCQGSEPVGLELPDCLINKESDKGHDATACFSGHEKRKELQGHLTQSAKTSNRIPVVYYWATWCAPCKTMTPNLEGGHEKEEIILFKVDVDKEINVGEKGIYGMHKTPVSSLPVVEVLCSNGKVKQEHGLKENITDYIKNEICNEQSQAEASE